MRVSSGVTITYRALLIASKAARVITGGGNTPCGVRLGNSSTRKHGAHKTAYLRAGIHITGRVALRYNRSGTMQIPHKTPDVCTSAYDIAGRVTISDSVSAGIKVHSHKTAHKMPCILHRCNSSRRIRIIDITIVVVPDKPAYAYAAGGQGFHGPGNITVIHRTKVIAYQPSYPAACSCNIHIYKTYVRQGGIYRIASDQTRIVPHSVNEQVRDRVVISVQGT